MGGRGVGGTGEGGWTPAVTLSVEGMGAERWEDGLGIFLGP